MAGRQLALVGSRVPAEIRTGCIWKTVDRASSTKEAQGSPQSRRREGGAALSAKGERSLIQHREIGEADLGRRKAGGERDEDASEVVPHLLDIVPSGGLEVSLAHICLLIDCPSDPDQLCCLLSEAGTRLTLLALHSPAPLRHPPVAAAGAVTPSGRVVWSFDLPRSDDSVAADDTVSFSVPTLVPSEKPVVLLPDALGDIHAVFLKDGTPLQGSPAANPFRVNSSSDACSSVLTPGVAVVDDWLKQYVVFFSNCGLAVAFDLWGNLTRHNILEEALDSAEVLSSLHEWFDQRQEMSPHSAAAGSPYRNLMDAPSANSGVLRRSREMVTTAAIGGRSEAAFLLPSHEGDLQFVTSFRKNSSFRSMFFAPCVNVQASLRMLEATGLKHLSPLPTLTDGPISGDPLLSVRIFDCLNILRRDMTGRRDFQSHPSYLVQVVNTEGLPLVPLQTAKCLPVLSTSAKVYDGAQLSVCEINVPLDLSRAPLLAAPKGRITLLLFALSGRPLGTSNVQLESVIIPIQQDTSLSGWLLVFSYLPIVFFVSIIFYPPKAIV